MKCIFTNIKSFFALLKCAVSPKSFLLAAPLHASACGKVYSIIIEDIWNYEEQNRNKWQQKQNLGNLNTKYINSDRKRKNNVTAAAEGSDRDNSEKENNDVDIETEFVPKDSSTCLKSSQQTKNKLHRQTSSTNDALQG